MGRGRSVERIRWPVWATVATLALLAGCPYESEVPLPIKRALPVDEALLGTWEAISQPPEEGRQPILVEILKYSDTDLLVDFRDEDGRASRLRAFAVDVAGTPILSVQDIDHPVDDREWMFFRYEISADGQLTTAAVGDEWLKRKFTSSEDLHRHLEKNIREPRLFEEPTPFARRPAPAADPADSSESQSAD